MYLDELLECVPLKEHVIIQTYDEMIVAGRCLEVLDKLEERMEKMEVQNVKVLIGALDITVKEE